ncbi:MAG: hypothetical protein IJ506_07245 [Clostridia bacterium]|nr:hypothetical protein [Clostridia bacterium]
MRKKWGLVALVVCLCFLIFGAIFFALGARAEAQEEEPFEEMYTVGDCLKLPEMSVDTPEGAVKGEPIIYCPDGTAKMAYSISLLDIGRYEIVYRATANGTVYKKSYSVVVSDKLNTITNKKDYIAYEDVTLNGGTATGLNIRLSYGSTYTCNQLIDLTKYSKEEDLISFFITPETVGTFDCRIFYVRFEDYYDPTNYFTARIYYTSDSSTVVYIAAKADAQESEQFYGAQKGTPDGPILSSIYGLGAPASFKGDCFGDPNYQVGLRYDEETMTLYGRRSANGQDYVIDFNNGVFKTGWNGFSSNIVKVSMWADRYSANQETAGVTITHIAGVDLSKEYLNINEPSDLKVDFGEYSKDSLPKATVGSPYKIFEATSEELYTPETITVNVYTGYGSNIQKNVNIVNGRFVPLLAVPHTIEYKVTDAFGYTKTECVKIDVEKTAEPIVLKVDTNALSCTLGEYLTVPQATVESGGNGRVTLSAALVYSDGTKCEIEDKSIRVLKKGDAKVVYTATDYAGNTETVEVATSIEDSQKPSMIYDPLLPRMYLVGGKYPVPELKAEDFSDGSCKEIETQCVVSADGATQPTVKGGYFTVMGEGAITLTYTATDALTRKNEKSYTVSVSDIGLSGTLSLGKFYSAENGSVKATDDNILLTATADNARFSPIRELNGRSLTARFLLAKNSVNFERIRFVVSDYRDESKKVEIALEGKYNATNETNMLAASVNGGTPFITSYLFGGDIKEIFFQLTDVLYLGTTRISVPTYTDGTSFDGFADFVYLDVIIEGVDTEALAATEGEQKAEIQLVELNGHTMTNAKRDRIKPQIMYMGTVRHTAEIGEEVELCAVKVFDVLNPYTKATLTLTKETETGKTVVAGVDKLPIENVPSDKVYKFIADDYGAYTVTYSYEVGDGTKEKFSYKINVYDTEAPELVLSSVQLKGKVNSAIKLPKIVCTDNIDSADAIILKKTYLAPDYTAGVIEGSKFTPTQKGVYKITFVVMDSSNNVTLRMIECVVE